MRKISHDVDQARKIAESIETGTEDIFRDFDLSSFMEHFKLDALEKYNTGPRFQAGLPARPEDQRLVAHTRPTRPSQTSGAGLTLSV